jgi:hypothetical protein
LSIFEHSEAQGRQGRAKTTTYIDLTILSHESYSASALDSPFAPIVAFRLVRHLPNVNFGGPN